MIKDKSKRCFVLSSRAARAFTIIELLVIITIVSVLITILLPAITLAREVNAQTVCQSNMRQSALITLSYVEDNHQYLPYSTQNTASPYSGSNPNHRKWNDYINDYDSDAANQTVSNAKYGRLRRCPGGSNLCWDSNLTQWGTTFWNNTSHVSIAAENTKFFAPNANWIVRDDQFAGGTPKRFDTIKKNLSRLMLVVDAGTSGNSGQEPTFAGGFPVDGGIRFRHAGGTSVNLAFLDGHAENWLGSDIWTARQFAIANPGPPYKYNPKDLFNGNINSRYPWGDSLE